MRRAGGIGWVIAALSLAATPLTAAATAPGTAAESASTTAAPPEIRAAATAATLAYRDAWRANLREAVMETMTPDAVIVPSGHEPVQGDAAISAFFWPAGGPATTITAMEQTIESIVGAGDVAVVSGQGLLTFHWTQDGRTESRTQRSTFVNVVRRLPDGDWKITHRAWNDLKPPAAPAASLPAAATAAPAPAPATTAGAPPAAPVAAAPYDSAWPQFSADGRSLVFASTREEGDWEIHFMQADGTDARRLTRAPGRDAHPYYTRDRRGILFQSPRDGGVEGEVDLYAMDLDGGNLRRLLATPGFDGVPTPSPDGAWIAFQRGTRKGDQYHWEIVLIDSHGRRERKLTDNTWSSQVPSWSPDGRRLVIHADPGGRDRLFLLDVATGKATPLGAPAAGKTAPGAAIAAGPSAATGAWVDQVPSFSPDGRFVAFTSTRDGGRDLYRIEVATGAVTRLTTGFDVGSQAAWSPEGRRLAFSAKRQGVDEIFLLDLDAGAPIRLTRGAEGWRSDDPRFDVEAGLQEYVRLLKSMDGERIAAAYEPDGAIVNPGMDPVVGRGAIKTFLGSFTGVRVTANAMTSTATELFGDMALVWGDYTESVITGDKPPADLRGRFVAEWGRQPNGRWLLRRMLTQPSGP